MSSPISRSPLSAPALLRWQFRVAHELLEAAIEPLTIEAVGRPTGTAASAGACYARVVLGEDLSINGVLSGGSPLAFSTWVGRTGVSEIPSLVEPTNWSGWAEHVRLNLAELRSYARAVYASTDAYLESLPEDALDQASGDLPASVLNALLLTLSMRRGEIVCLGGKGAG